MNRLFLLRFLFLVLPLVSCSENIFDEIADKDTSEAVYFQAKLELNERDYVTAITLFESLDPTFLAVRERTGVYASAYSGRCGLEFLTLLNTLQNPGANSVLSLLMAGFPGATLLENQSDCGQAETILNTIGDQDARNGDENLLMAFTSLSKIGVTLSHYADDNEDQVVDGGFDQCDLVAFPAADVAIIGAALANSLLSLTAIGTGYVDDATTDVTALCGLHPDLAVFCTQTDPSLFTPDQIKALRYIIGSSDYGLNSCGGRDFPTCTAFYEAPGPPDCE